LNRAVGWAVALVLASGAVRTQEVSLEYRLKGAYLLNFTKFIEWPPNADPGPFRLCLAGHNPFGEALAAAAREESVNGRVIDLEIIVTPVPGCDLLFVPRDVSATPFLRASRGAATLTVGEVPRFIAEGGIVNFVLQENTVRFQINAEEAERVGLRISSQLLRLAREPGR
jgi:hypothetical protein